jgi:hypothetical protein
VAIDASNGCDAASASEKTFPSLAFPTVFAARVVAETGNSQTSFFDVEQSTCPNEQAVDAHANETKSSSALAFTNSPLRKKRNSYTLNIPLDKLCLPAY